jgi:hypothetical protein
VAENERVQQRRREVLDAARHRAAGRPAPVVVELSNEDASTLAEKFIRLVNDVEAATGMSRLDAANRVAAQHPSLYQAWRASGRQ